MRFLIILLIVGLTVSVKAEKILCEVSSGKIISLEPDAARVVNGTLESRIVSKPDWSKVAFGKGFDLMAINTQKVVRIIYDAGSNIIGAVTNFYTTSHRKNNVADIADFQKLYPLSEAERQKAKPLNRREFENRYIKYCKALTATTNNVPLTLVQLKAMWQTLTAAEKASTLVEFILLNIEGQKEGGADWLNDCKWHPELEK